MKTLIIYSSKTGNTLSIAEAIHEALPDSDILPVENAPAPETLPGEYGMVCVGYWVDKGMPDAKARAYLENLRGVRAALFGTLGAWPDSEHARDCIRKSEALLKEPERGNTVMGSFICQGKVDPRVVEMMNKVAADVHPMTPERKARLEEAARHPDDTDRARAKECFVAFAVRAEELTA